MNINEHIPDERLGALMRNELPLPLTTNVRLHLSYCPLCQGRRDELWLRHAATRMWDEYEKSEASGDRHFGSDVFEQYWRGEIMDDKLLEHITAHCIICRNCRRRRRDVRLRLESNFSFRQL